MEILKHIQDGLSRYYLGDIVSVKTKADGFYTGRIKFIGEDCIDLDWSEKFDARVIRLYSAEMEWMVKGDE